MINRHLYLFVLLVLIAMLSGCAATTTALRYKDLEVQGQMSNSIFINPVGKNTDYVFVLVSNTTGQQMDDFAAMLIEQLREKGLAVTDDPMRADIIMQVNLLSIGQTDASAMEQYTGMGFGGAVVGATVGALVASSGHEWVGAGIGGLAMSLVEMVSGSLVKAVEFGMISDIQITLNNKVYQTRVGSRAVQVNLSFEDAYPALRDNQIAIISGIFQVY